MSIVALGREAEWSIPDASGGGLGGGAIALHADNVAFQRHEVKPEAGFAVLWRRDDHTE